MKNHLKCQLAAACVSVYCSSLDNDDNIKLKVLKMYKRTFIRNNNNQECGSSNKAEGKGRWRERQCGRFLKFLIIIAILFPPASKQVIVCGPFLSLWSLSTFCSADWRFSKREREKYLKFIVLQPLSIIHCGFPSPFSPHTTNLLYVMLVKCTKKSPMCAHFTVLLTKTTFSELK